MHYVQVVERLETFDGLDEYFPDFIFVEKVLILLMHHYLLVKIPAVAVFHDDTKAVILFINENLLILRNILAPNTRQNSYFVDCVPLFLL